MKHAPMAPPTISAPIPQWPLPTDPHSHSQTTHHREKVHFAGSDSPSTSASTSSSPTPPSPLDRNQSQPSSSISFADSPTPDLHALALHLLDTLYNKHDLTLARTLIHPDVRVSTNNDDATLRSRDEYLAYWARRTKRVPDLRARCRECAVDEGQRKVWCVSELYTEPSWDVVNHDQGKGKGLGPDSQMRRKESVDMLWFDERGRLVGGCDWVRSVRRREGDDD